MPNTPKNQLVQTLQVGPDRLANVEKYANELSESRLREMEGVAKIRWNAFKRAEKRNIIQRHKPWLRSTGPRTGAGMARSAQNACKMGYYGPYGRTIRLMARLHGYMARISDIEGKRWSRNPSVLKDRRMKADDLIIRLRQMMVEASIESAMLDARLIVQNASGMSAAELISRGQFPLSTQVIEIAQEFCNRRIAGEPVSRLRGEREFWGLSFKISADTLDPRPDTETLVEAAIKRANVILKERQATEGSQGIHKPLRILDLGTGSGCILISLLKELPNITGVGIDLNPGALEISRENAIRHGVADRVEFRHGSWWDAVHDGESFDLIVSNPPYIPESDIGNLAPEVRNHDPFMALSGGADGFDSYKIILGNLKKHLGCGGFALLEIGKDQEKELARLVDESNMWVSDSYIDLGGILRVVEISHGEK